MSWKRTPFSPAALQMRAPAPAARLSGLHGRRPTPRWGRPGRCLASRPRLPPSRPSGARSGLSALAGRFGATVGCSSESSVLGLTEAERFSYSPEGSELLRACRSSCSRRSSGARAVHRAAVRGRAPGRRARIAAHHPRRTPSASTRRASSTVSPRLTLYLGVVTLTSFATLRGSNSSRTADSSALRSTACIDWIIRTESLDWQHSGCLSAQQRGWSRWASQPCLQALAFCCGLV